MQDVLEEYFGLHRSMGCRSENPNLHRFGYDENGARAARSAGAVKGNTSGAQANRKRPAFYDIDETKLKKRKSGKQVDSV